MTFYDKLDSEKQEFRLIRFRGHDTEYLEWELKTFSIHGDSPWTALSYRWNEATATDAITIGGQVFQVRHNLFEFLHQMATEDRRDWVFVDAICINQDDVAERASQVSLMGDIYRKAQEVIAWICPEHPVHGLGPSEMKLFSSLLSKGAKIADQNPFPAELQREVRSCVDDMKLVLSSSGYWSRVWIVQEVLLAKKLTIRCYSLEFDWTDIAISDEFRLDLHHIGRPRKVGVMNWLARKTSMAFGASFGSSESLYMFLKLQQWSESATDDLRRGKLLAFHEAVGFFAGHRCCRVHDRIFGLLGITKCYIPPDYTISITDLYTAALYSCVLSLWTDQSRKRRLQSNGQVLSKHEILEGLGLPDADLAAIGEVLMSAFELEPFEDFCFSMNFEILSCFAPEQIRLVQESLSWPSFIEAKSAESGHDIFVFMQTLHDGGTPAMIGFTQDFQLRLRDAFARLTVAKQNDLKIRGPGVDGKATRYSELRERIHAICDDIWARYEADIEGPGGEE